MLDRSLFWVTARTCSGFVLVMAILLAGCGPGASPRGAKTNEKQAAAPLVIRVLVVDDQPLAAAVQEQWQVRASGDELQVRTANSADLKTAQRLSADVVVFPARRMGELVERELIQPLPDAPQQAPPAGEEPPPTALAAVHDLLPTVRQCDASWGRRAYAVALGSPQLVLLYRPDLFKSLELVPPTTWAEYQAVVERLSDRAALGELAPEEGKPWSAALEPASQGWAGTMLLARAASAVRSQGQLYTLFDIDKMEARIAAPPYVRAAQEMAKALQGVEARLSPEEVRRAFFAGECGMAITWPSAATTEGEELQSKTPVAFAELPGRSDWYKFQQEDWSPKNVDDDPRASLCAISGRLAAVTREARQSKSAFQFLTWLASDDVSRALSPASLHTTVCSNSQLSSVQQWLGSQVTGDAARQYADIVRSAFSRTTWMPVVRIPGSDAYHAALDEAVQAALSDPGQAEAALRSAAHKWDEITRQHDVSKQRRAYQRSLGNDF